MAIGFTKTATTAERDYDDEADAAFLGTEPDPWYSPGGRYKSDSTVRWLCTALLAAAVVLLLLVKQPFSYPWRTTPNALDVTIVIPSYFVHVDKVASNLQTMMVHCQDCRDYAVHIVVSDSDAALFESKITQNDAFRAGLPRLKLVSFEGAVRSIEGDRIDGSWNTTTLCHSHFACQSAKKMYGCLASGSAHCWSMDSESIFLRPTTVSTLVGDYIRAPYVIMTSNMMDCKDPGAFNALAATQRLLNNYQALPWMLEEYLWIFDRAILDEMRTTINREYAYIPTEMDPEIWWFVELTYYATIYLNQARYPRFRMRDTAQMWGIDAWHALNATGLPRAAACGVLEHAVQVYLPRPDLIPMYADLYDRQRLRVHRMCNGGEAQDTVKEFIRAIPSLVWSPSDYGGPDILQAALKRQF